MTRKEQLSKVSSRNRRFIEVEHGGFVYKLELASTSKQLQEAKALDDEVFAGHVGISMKELEEVSENGAVILMRDNEGNLIGESQVITSPISEHPNLEDDEAYNYGTAVRSELHNNGYAQILFKAQEKIAIEAGKKRSTLTVRLENAGSIRGRLKSGFHITGYRPDHYGPYEEGGARFFMEKQLDDDSHSYISPEKLAESHEQGHLTVIKSADSEELDAHSLVGIRFTPGDELDHAAHQIVQRLFEKGDYVGIGVLKPDEVNGTLGEDSMLVFLKNY